MKTFGRLIAVVVLLILAGLGFIYSGFYDVAADTEHTNPVQWALRTTQEHAVERRAEQVRPPDWLAHPDPAVLRKGLVHYQEMCVTCHGAPGVPVSEIGMGLNPDPPELTRHGDELGENFWIIKHGIKMTGMPSFGMTHEDDEIWAIVAFLQTMPKLTEEQYHQMVEEAEAAEPAGHEHEEGKHEHS